jgi:hypothetical protein
MNKPTIKIVSDEQCPICGAIWGHEDKSLDFPNRPKVGDENGVWWWKCYNPKCEVGYYEPKSGEWEREPTKEEYEKMMRKIDEDMKDVIIKELK